MMGKKDGFERMETILNRKTYPEAELLLPALFKVEKVMAAENPEIRPPDGFGRPGGLLLLQNLPTIIVPDLHARPAFLWALANWVPPFSEAPVLRLLEKGKIQVLCVGDGFHSESPRYDRWMKAYLEYEEQYKKHKFMDSEMNDGLRLMLLVMDWKTNYPDVFHFLKGNHENVTNELSDDNRSFYKFAEEGEMVRLWFEMFLGDNALDSYYRFEKFLPVFAVGNCFCVSHAEPHQYYSREQIINCYAMRDVIYDFTWTDNDRSIDGTVAAFLEDWFPGNSDVKYFGGHRVIKEKYNLRADGKYVQIHNPLRFPVVYLRDSKDLQKDFGIHYLDQK